MTMMTMSFGSTTTIRSGFLLDWNGPIWIRLGPPGFDVIWVGSGLQLLEMVSIGPDLDSFWI